MTDSIVDDVQVLLDKELGDKRILEQILRAAQNNEVISNFERNYVRKLAEKYLRPKPPTEKIPEIPKQTVADVSIPSSSSSTASQTAQLWSQTPKVTKSISKNNMIMIGGGIAVLAIIIIAAVSLSGISDTISNNIGPDQTSSISKSFSINADSNSYKKGDIISITGKSNLSLGSKVTMSIENSNDELVWSEQVSVKNNGQFNTLTFAGGFGWENTGTFMIKAETNSEKATYTISFSG
ncbi:MAG TPA: hypothetical protein VMW55_10090 [Nitrosopumilaceae archaeon]|jgi:hypothetical protein|nr:hypothetical protein [Nitrosopumilaceae archaeon]